jgi:hypothetical protein
MLILQVLSITAGVLQAFSVQASQEQRSHDYDCAALFQLAKEPSTHKNQVNTFANTQAVYSAYKRATQDSLFTLAVPPLEQAELHRIGHNEVVATLEYQENINSKLRTLIAGHGWQPLDQFKSFRKLFLDKNIAEVNRLKNLACEVAAWQGFKLAAQPNQLGLEFFTEWTNTGSRLINNLNAFFFAAFLGTSREVTPGAWDTFKQTWEYEKTAPFRMLLEEIVRPVAGASVGPDQEGMAISTALQDFRRRDTSTFIFPAVGNTETEQLFTSKFATVKEKLAKAESILASYSTVEQAYKEFKSQPQCPMLEANNIRREIGGTGFLVALQQAFKSGLLTEQFYREHKEFINRIAQLTNEMDKNNFEVYLGYGKYEGDAIPSPYAFFGKLSN